MEVKQQYRNMKDVIDRHPEIVDYAMEAIRRAGLTPVRSSIRGGTDGSRLSFMGLPCPNIFAGEHAFHSRLEWVSRQDMEKAARDHRASGEDLGRAGVAARSRRLSSAAPLRMTSRQRASQAFNTTDAQRDRLGGRGGRLRQFARELWLVVRAL